MKNLKTIIITSVIMITLVLTAIFKEKPDYQDPRYRSGIWTEKVK